MKASSYIILIGILFFLASCKSDNKENSKEDAEQAETEIHSIRENISRTDTLGEFTGNQDILIGQAVREKEQLSEKQGPSEMVIKPILKDNPSPDKAKGNQKSKFVFEEQTVDFGFIKMGEEIDHSFYFKNVDKKAHSISNVQASCGCTMAAYPFIPIEPNEKGKIDVHFNSKGRFGRQTAEITIFIEGESEVYNLYLKGVVSAPLANDGLIDSTENN